MNPTLGRPKSENPLNVDVKVRIDQSTNKALLEYCKRLNVTKTEAIREGIHLLLQKKSN